MVDFSSFFHSSSPWLFDVFLTSSRGTDSYEFTSQLLRALQRRGFSTFFDDMVDIGSEAIKAIEQSRVSIVVFSKKYAAAPWCLNRLVKIMECKRDLNRIVLPIFYDVDPSDVQTQGGFYSKAFDMHERRFKGTSSFYQVEKWRSALIDAADLSGWHYQTARYEDEFKFIDVVVNGIKDILDRI